MKIPVKFSVTIKNKNSSSDWSVWNLRGKTMKTKVKQIFVILQVSLDSRVRDIINRNMIAPSQHTFDEAQLQIYTLMHRDSYPRFVNSPLYKNMLRTVGVEPESSTSS